MTVHTTPVLIPCPFCGGEASHAKCTATRDRDSEGNKGTFTGYFINCIVCGADNQGIAEGWKTPELAAEKWNRRATHSERKPSAIAALTEAERAIEAHVIVGNSAVRSTVVQQAIAEVRKIKNRLMETDDGK